MKDAIKLLGIVCRCRIGVPAWERKTRQKILVDLTIAANLKKAGKSDNLKDSIDYFSLEKKIRRTAEAGSFKLLERLAQVLAETTLLFDKRIRKVAVTLHKTPKVMPNTKEVIVEIQRGR